MPPTFSAEEQEIASFVQGAIPRWFWDTPRDLEDLAAIVRGMDVARQRVDYLARQAQILLADGPLGDDPDWLNQHAIDRGTHRKAGESDDLLRIRLRTFEDAITVPALLGLIGAMLDEAGVVSNDFEIIEPVRDGAYFTIQEDITGTASGSDAFTKVGDVMTLHLAGVTFQGGMLYWDRSRLPPKITIAGATSGANNGTFTVTGFDDDSIQWTNAAGVAEGYAGTWTVLLNDAVDLYEDAYFDNGYRLATKLACFIAVLPYDTSEDLRVAIDEALRQRKAAGVVLTTEARSIP